MSVSTAKFASPSRLRYHQRDHWTKLRARPEEFILTGVADANGHDANRTGTLDAGVSRRSLRTSPRLCRARSPTVGPQQWARSQRRASNQVLSSNTSFVLDGARQGRRLSVPLLLSIVDRGGAYLSRKSSKKSSAGLVSLCPMTSARSRLVRQLHLAAFGRRRLKRCPGNDAWISRLARGRGLEQLGAASLALFGPKMACARRSSALRPPSISSSVRVGCRPPLFGSGVLMAPHYIVVSSSILSSARLGD